MKCVFALACMLVVVWSSPIPERECDEVFNADICSQYDSAGSELRVRRQAPPPPPGGNGGDDKTAEKELLEKLLLKKLKFLTDIGLLKNVPFLGQAIHNMVENDPEGVSKALSGGIFAILGLVREVMKLAVVG